MADVEAPVDARAAQGSAIVLDMRNQSSLTKHNLSKDFLSHDSTDLGPGGLGRRQDQRDDEGNTLGHFAFVVIFFELAISRIITTVLRVSKYVQYVRWCDDVRFSTELSSVLTCALRSERDDNLH